MMILRGTATALSTIDICVLDMPLLDTRNGKDQTKDHKNTKMETDKRSETVLGQSVREKRV